MLCVIKALGLVVEISILKKILHKVSRVGNTGYLSAMRESLACFIHCGFIQLPTELVTYFSRQFFFVVYS